jgi:hypothetical protein
MNRKATAELQEQLREAKVLIHCLLDAHTKYLPREELGKLLAAAEKWLAENGVTNDGDSAWR